MKVVIEYLEKRQNEIKNELQNGKHDSLIELKEINNAINWLKKIDELNLKHIQKYEIIELPEPVGHGYSAYRLMIDNETDDIKYWTELKIDNKSVEVIMGDILITRK
jgi:hypothetical protein